MEPTAAQRKVRMIYEHRGEHFMGTAEVPTPNGILRFKTLIPMVDVRTQIKQYLDTQSSEISGDPQLVARLPVVASHIAKIKAKRHLTTAIRVRLGGPVQPKDVAGPAGFADRIATQAQEKSAYRSAIAFPNDEVGSDDIAGDDIGAFGFLKKIGKGIGKGVKGVGKGIGKGAKVVGKGTFKGVKAVGKAGGKIVSNPITGALLSTVPGGSAAAAILAAARGGSPGAKQAIQEITSAANDGDPNAQASLAALNAAGKTPIPMGLIIGGGIGALALAMVMMNKKGGNGIARLPAIA